VNADHGPHSRHAAINKTGTQIAIIPYPQY